MLIFAKDIGVREPRHSCEDRDPELREYMEYQRNLFPYTIVRAALDLAYKETDDILNYIENDHQPPPDSNRQDYPADIEGWYKQRFPWSSVFLTIEDLHSVLVILIKAMDSFRTRETMNAYHLMVLYDCVHNIVTLYNSLLSENPDRARDIHLSKNVPVNFDDFINNYWPHLDFMILSRADYPHARHIERKRGIEEDLQRKMAEGNEPLKALDEVAPIHALDSSALHLLRRDPLNSGDLELASTPLTVNHYEHLEQETKDTQFGLVKKVDAEYLMSFRHTRRNTVQTMEGN